MRGAKGYPYTSTQGSRLKKKKSWSWMSLVGGKRGLVCRVKIARQKKELCINRSAEIDRRAINNDLNGKKKSTSRCYRIGRQWARREHLAVQTTRNPQPGGAQKNPQGQTTCADHGMTKKSSRTPKKKKRRMLVSRERALGGEVTKTGMEKPPPHHKPPQPPPHRCPSKSKKSSKATEHTKWKNKGKRTGN